MQQTSPEADLRALSQALEQGVVLLRAGHGGDAERHYTSALARWPGHADLLQLLGVALKAQGKLAEAERPLRESLAAKPAQAHVWANLGNLLAEMKRNRDAVDAYEQALKLDERAVAAWLGLAGARLAIGNTAGATEAYERAQALDPQSATAAIGLAGIASRALDHDRAEALLRQVIARDPKNVTALYNLGIQVLQGDAKAARPLMERALALRPGRADMMTGLGYALQVEGSTDAALARYRQAIAANPLHLPAHEHLARLQWQVGRHDTYLADLEAVIAQRPDVPELHVTRANLLGMAGAHALAGEAFERAAKLRSNDPSALDGIARMAAEQGDAARCLAYHEQAVKAAPAHPGFLVSYGHSLLRFGEARKAIAVLEQVVALAPDHQLALADLALAFRATNDPREAWLADYERFAARIELRPPRGYTDMEVFNADLDRALDDLHHVRSAPIDQTLRNGTQTLGSLFGHKLDLVTRLRERIDEAVAAYITGLPDDASHPFLCRKARAFRHRGSWSSRLKTSGYHVTHVHPDGWISSAYYAALPKAVDDEAKKEGWFTLGAPPFDLGWAEPVRRHIRPKVGALILFPSYYYHGTLPFSGNDARTTIAFDAVPAP